MTDQETSQALERIERYSTWIVSEAETVQRNVRMLKYQPGFETKAGAALQLAQARLETALRETNDALTGFAAKPVEKPKAA